MGPLIKQGWDVGSLRRQLELYRRLRALKPVCDANLADVKIVELMSGVGNVNS